MFLCFLFLFFCCLGFVSVLFRFCFCVVCFVLFCCWIVLVLFLVCFWFFVFFVFCCWLFGFFVEGLRVR